MLRVLKLQGNDMSILAAGMTFDMTAAAAAAAEAMSAPPETALTSAADYNSRSLESAMRRWSAVHSDMAAAGTAGSSRLAAAPTAGLLGIATPFQHSLLATSPTAHLSTANFLVSKLLIDLVIFGEYFNFVSRTKFIDRTETILYYELYFPPIIARSK